MIPKHIHFIFFGFTKFLMIHYLAVKSAIHVHKPDNVYFHYTVEPKDNPLWEDIKKQVTLVHTIPPEKYNGVELKYYQYKADVVRLEALYKYGGIYMDIDVLSVNPFNELYNNSCVMGIESGSNLDSSDITQAKSITNAVIMTEPKHPFIIDWLRETANNLVDKGWAYHAVNLPLEMLKSNNYNVHIEPCRSFMPFDFHNLDIFSDDENIYNELARSYTMHFWETIWWDRLKEIDNNYLKTVNNNFTRLFNKYIIE